ncbi:glycosyl transferases group 1 family protein [Mycolicibacterium hassiacum DSM 44199]|jgi:glycosyltransferase involved in cell wall biosynthesis|uniref:Glycosyl transferases group 1 family protein n=1 Tax=Mycolicibacterium hassiacum (strain DSM 44199 / CIP 105218 / JCM 12690 / 3849) TaxID=1122247 RepID=K5BBY8_MYCHD|nr:glycosyltransferase [Mycolicibacterium hassiacum]EKF21092.1 glycosyl transferases group 1 family protein [Mycolicibacterium hassiacum DSM 44199]MBX5486856.1 glycosyltransferase [Mycolicibacterium hassiacum]MDA4087221.1 glycosyl transferase family 1 [Mycolicibacterium hassiacum DSM 44199]VCT88432.1 D-inositol-3-phosphate glycosyltransferase [Mycolicibacterium hassiacum DSM 44199]
MIDTIVPQGNSSSAQLGLLLAPAPVKGLTTFGAGLSAALRARGAEVDVIDCGIAPAVGDWVDRLNRSDIAIVEHTFDSDDDDILDVLDGLRVLSVVVIHTVPQKPDRRQRAALSVLTAGADHVIVMSDAARQRLCASYGVPPRKVSTIPHGATVPTGPRGKRARRPTILTWGWLGPGKGIERVIDAMATLRDLPGHPNYLVAGPTHPRALSGDTDAYRTARITQAAELGVADSVTFDGGYYTGARLTELICQAAVVVLPYDSTDQVTSGVLVQAVAHGRPVVATAFPHARELLGGGAGTIVDHDDPVALATALRQILTRPRLAGDMAAAARDLAPQLAWSEVATDYLGVVRRLLAASVARSEYS